MSYRMLCNNCGEEITSFQDGHEVNLGSTFSVEGGFWSYHLFDMTNYKFSLCELCLRKMFDQFKIPPKITDGLPSGIANADYQQDKIEYDYLIWKDSGGHHQAYLNGKCNKRKDCNNDAKYSIISSDEFTEDSFCEEHSKPIHPNNWTKLIPFVPNHLKPFL